MGPKALLNFLHGFVPRDTVLCRGELTKQAAHAVPGGVIPFADHTKHWNGAPVGQSVDKLRG